MLYRKSQKRERILEVLKGTDCHPTADWVYNKLKDEIPDLSLGTVYRNLSVLIDQGKIIKLPFGSTFDRFDGNTEPHYHFFCEKCERVEDIELSFVDQLNKDAQKNSGFVIRGHRLEFFGICNRCSNNV